MKQPRRVFISYSRKDEGLVDELDTHLASLKRRDLVTVWKDRAIDAGKEWENAIRGELEQAEIILLVVSAAFLASEYIWKVELEAAMRRHEAGTARVIPVIARACEWHDMPFARLQALPRDGKAVMSWSDRDVAWTDVTKGIARVVESMPERIAAPSPAAAAPSTAPATVPFAPGRADHALADDLLLDVHSAAVRAGLAGSRGALLAGVDRAVVASLPEGVSPAAQLRTDLDELNRAVLEGGGRPLRTWLRNAHQLAHPRVEARVFQRALDALDAGKVGAGG